MATNAGQCSAIRSIIKYVFGSGGFLLSECITQQVSVCILIMSESSGRTRSIDDRPYPWAASLLKSLVIRKENKILAAKCCADQDTVDGSASVAKN